MNQNRKVMAYTKLIVEKQDNICTVKINNPEALNALNSTILKELDAAFTAIGEDDSVDVVILKPHAYAPRKHLPGILDTVKCISGKTRDLFCDKHIKFPVLCIFKHFFELLTMFGLYARYAIINISFSKLPVSIAFNKFFIILGLVFNGYLLVFGICTYTSVKSNS